MVGRSSKGISDTKGFVGVGFGGADNRTLDFLAKYESLRIHQKLISSRYIKDSKVKAIVHEFIKTHYHEGACGLFGRGDPAVIDKLKELLLEMKIDLKEEQIHEVIETAVQRARNWAHLSQLYEGCIPEIEVFEPVRSCEFCKAIHGKIIRVKTAYNKMMSLIKMSAEEFEMELEGNIPIVENIGIFIDQGLLPPYHFRCKGTIIKKVRND
jgi:hypothetical protein